jgi:hypothetical protein
MIRCSPKNESNPKTTKKGRISQEVLPLSLCACLWNLLSGLSLSHFDGTDQSGAYKPQGRRNRHSRRELNVVNPSVPATNRSLNFIKNDILESV